MITLPATVSDLLRGPVRAALRLLPDRMTSDEARVMLGAIALQESGLATRQQYGGPAHGGIMERLEQARQRLLQPHHHPTCREVATMADANSMCIAGRSSNGTPLYECVCPDCGAVRLQDKRKIGRPCHPCSLKRRSTHGLTGHWLYRVWSGAKARCTIPSSSNYDRYGGRGINMCSEWTDDPEAFITWALSHGAKRGLELDRIDPNGNYSPENCRFISHRENSRNRTNARCDVATAARIKRQLSDGTSIAEAARNTGVPYMVAWHIAKGNTWKDA